MYVTCFTAYVLYLLLHYVNISLFLKYDHVILYKYLSITIVNGNKFVVSIELSVLSHNHKIMEYAHEKATTRKIKRLLYIRLSIYGR